MHRCRCHGPRPSLRHSAHHITSHTPQNNSPRVFQSPSAKSPCYTLSTHLQRAYIRFLRSFRPRALHHHHRRSRTEEQLTKQASRQYATGRARGCTGLRPDDSRYLRQQVAVQHPHTIVTEALEAATSSDSLDRRIWRSFVPLTGDALTQKDLEKAFTAARIRDVQELFALLDLDQNGDVSLEEMISTVIRMGQERIAIWKSTHDIKSAVRVLDHFFQVFILIGTGFTYAAFSATHSRYILPPSAPSLPPFLSLFQGLYRNF